MLHILFVSMWTLQLKNNPHGSDLLLFLWLGTGLIYFRVTSLIQGGQSYAFPNVKTHVGNFIELVHGERNNIATTTQLAV